MLKQRFLVQFISKFGIKILGVLAGLIVARVAGPEVVGIIAFGTAYVSIWGFITGLFGTGHIKLISEGHSLKDCVATYSWLQGGSILAYFLFVSGFYFVQKIFFQGAFESRTHEIVIFLLLLANVAEQILNFGNVTFTAKLEQFKANYPLILKAVLYQAGRIIVVLLGMRAIALASVNLLSTLLAVPLAWSILKRLEFGRFNRELFIQHRNYAIPVFLIVLINSVLEYSDKLILAHFADTTELGYYSAAFSIGGIFLLISTSAGTVFFPLFSSLIAQRNWLLVNHKIRAFQKFLVRCIFPLICLLCIIGSPLITTLIGEQYLPSVQPFKILLFASYLSVVGIPFSNIISGMGRFYLSVVINLVCLVVYLVSIYLLTNPEYFGLGAVGIAINLLILNAVRNSLYLFTSWRIGEIELANSSFLPYLVISLVSVPFLMYETTFSQFFALWWLVIGPVYLLLVYSLLYMFGLFTRQDFEQLLEVISFRRLLRYVLDEMRNR